MRFVNSIYAFFLPARIMRRRIKNLKLEPLRVFFSPETHTMSSDLDSNNFPSFKEISFSFFKVEMSFE